jgi:radical SAM protein with 4Fe4S-binding SPASM domain
MGGTLELCLGMCSYPSNVVDRQSLNHYIVIYNMNKIVHIFKLGLAYKVKKATKLSFPPYQYTIEPTNICNLKCSFCPQSNPEHKDLREKGYLSVENFKLFLDKITDIGGSNRNLNLTLDGEPLLNPSFIDLIEVTCERGYFPVFASNGTRLNKEITDRFIKAGPFRVSIDFASDENIFESIRGKKGHFKLVRENLNYLIECARNNPNVQVDIYDISTFAGADPNSSLAKMQALFPSNLPGNIKFLSRQFHNFCGHLSSQFDADDYRLCPYPWSQMAVAWNGDCVACCRDTMARTVLGNIYKESISDIWNGDKYQRFRGNLIIRHPERNAACKDCDLPYSIGKKRWKVSYILRSLLGR